MKIQGRTCRCIFQSHIKAYNKAICANLKNADTVTLEFKDIEQAV